MIKNLFKSLILIVMIWFVGFIFFNRHINAYVIDEETHTDAIVVLTGGRNRIPEAVSLLNDGKAEKLFISGVPKDVSLDEISKRKDIQITTDREIALDNKSTNTIENAIEACGWMENNNIGSIRLVTSNYHIPRALEEFKAQNGNIIIIAHPVYSENVSKNPFDSWHIFALIASEYNKFLYVYLKYLL